MLNLLYMETKGLLHNFLTRTGANKSWQCVAKKKKKKRHPITVSEQFTPNCNEFTLCHETLRALSRPWCNLSVI